MNFAPLIRFIEIMPHDGNHELVLLKGHLLVEEQLTALIHRAAKRPEFLPALRFADKVKLARANSSSVDAVWLWDALSKMNAARNALSHSLEKSEFDQKLKSFIDFVEAKKHRPSTEALSDRFGPIHWAIYCVHCILSVEATFEFSKLKVETLLAG